jgi:hypothetical protein
MSSLGQGGIFQIGLLHEGLVTRSQSGVILANNSYLLVGKLSNCFNFLFKPFYKETVVPNHSSVEETTSQNSMRGSRRSKFLAKNHEVIFF